jgi:hypothetical protein
VYRVVKGGNAQNFCLIKHQTSPIDSSLCQRGFLFQSGNLNCQGVQLHQTTGDDGNGCRYFLQYQPEQEKKEMTHLADLHPHHSPHIELLPWWHPFQNSKLFSPSKYHQWITSTSLVCRALICTWNGANWNFGPCKSS